MKEPLARPLSLAAIAALPAVAAAAQPIAGEPSDPGRLWWTWVAVALLIVAALAVIIMSRDRGRDLRR